MRDHVQVTDVAAWVRSVPDVASRLRDAPPARIAWIGCDDADALVALAREYPRVSVYATSRDDDLLAAVTDAIWAGRVADRVVVRRGDWISPRLSGWIDVALITTRLHDEHDWSALGPALRQLLRDGGVGFVRTSGFQPQVPPPAGTVDAGPGPHLRQPAALPDTLDHGLWLIRRG